jgi:hypothetical protein
MADKWVDGDKYFGPDRRRRGGQKRWQDRRHLDEAGEPPPLGAMLRRLRVHMLGLETPEDRGLTLQLLMAAIADAERRRLLRCADALKRAEHGLRSGAPVSVIEAAITEAMLGATDNPG